jgi:hypothetical protein
MPRRDHTRTTRSRPDLNKGRVPIGPGLAVFARQEFRTTIEELGVDVVCLVTFDRDVGRLVVDDLRITRQPNGPPITGTLLRRVPMAALLASAMSLTALREVSPGRWQPIGTERIEGEDDDHYVARIYTMASACGHRPTKAVQEMLGVAESTATQKVGRARLLGLLPKTTPGKAKA